MEGVDTMNKEKLKQVFNKAEEDKMDIAIELILPERKEPEIIIVKNSNLRYKLEYYENTYDDELRHMLNSNIKIRDVYVIDFVPNYMQF